MKKTVFSLSLFVGLLLIGTCIDTDDWFLLNCGRYVEMYGIPHTEPFSMHEGWDYVMQQWLFALGLWKLYSALGLSGLVLYAWAGGAAILLFYDRLVRLAAGGGDTRAAEFLLVLPMGCLLAVTFFVPRPQLLSMTICLVEVYLLERYREERPRWLLAALPAMSALLVNLHAALWPMFLVLLLPHLAEALFGARLAKWLPHDVGWSAGELVLLLALCAAAGLCNPYGVDAMLYSSRSYGLPILRESIIECKPLSLGAPAGLLAGSGFFLLYFALTAVYARHPQPLRYLLLAAGTGFMGLLSIRSLFHTLLFATFPLARVWRGRTLPRPAWTPRRKALVAALAAANIVLFGTEVLPARYGVPPLAPQSVAAVDALAAQAAAGGRAPQETRVYTDIILGNYAAFCGFRVYVDARPEVYMAVENHHADVYAEYVRMQNGLVRYQDVLDAYPFDALLVHRDDILWTYLPEDPAYECVWDSATAGITGAPADDLRIYRKK